MRRSIASVALFAAFAASACTDTSPTGTALSPNASSPLLNEVPLSDQIDAMIADFFPKGLETSTGARWETVKDKKAQDDFEGAKTHFFSLADWIKKKIPDVTLDPGKYPKLTTQTHAATQLVYAMSVWLFVGADQPLPELAGDSEFAVVPAGQAATVVTEKKQAGVDIEAGSTEEDRVILVVEDAHKYPGQCNGPLDTELCQYPLFYKFESFPHKRLNKVAHFAVCMATTGDRTPLDYVEGHPSRTETNKEGVHDRMRLAHEKPANEADYSAGSTIVDGIEILKKSAVQKGFTVCDKPVDYALGPGDIRGGWRGRAQRALLAVANFAGRLVTPKDLYAFSSGPEHDGEFFSSFNGVDPGSKPDLKPGGITAPADVFRGDPAAVGFSVSNKSRRQLDGEATATSKKTSAAVYLVRDVGESTQEQLLCRAGEVGICEFSVGTDGDGDGVFLFLPDDAAQPFSLSLLVPETVDPGEWFVEVRVALNPGRLGEVSESNNIVRSTTPILIKKKQSIAIYKNYDAWNSPKEETMLQGAPFNFTKDVDYVVRPMSALASESGIPATTSLIIITSASAGDAEQIAEQKAGAENLDEWVRNGGWLVIHAADNHATDSYTIPGLSGPVEFTLNCTGLTLAVANHALIRGPDAAAGTDDDLTDSNIDNGNVNPANTPYCYDNHGSLTTTTGSSLLPGNAEVLMREQGSGHPVYATYTLGAGRVIVTTLTIEFPLHPDRTMLNHLYWAVNGLNPPAALVAKAPSLTPSFSTSGSDEVKVNTDGSPRNP